VIEDLNTWVTQIDSGAQVNDLTPAPSFLSGRSREQFLENEDQNLQALRETSENLATWLDEQVQQHEIISILGM
jgi:hypothetical protein